MRPGNLGATLVPGKRLFMVTEYDVAIVGGGILGLASALALSDRYPNAGLIVVDKEPVVAAHQTGHNSGVLHSGLYYRPGSLKARLCVSGAQKIVEFCDREGIAYERSGKVVVATTAAQLPALDDLERRGRANGVRGLRRLGPDALREIEPHAQAVAALHVPTTGTVDFGEVAKGLARVLARRGVDVRTSFGVARISVGSDRIGLESPAGRIRARGIVNCAGLYADRVAAMAGVDSPVRIIPFRGEYYDVVGASAALIGSSIYPVPDPQLPFLGVHLTRGINGEVHAGPNAVLAGAREGYRWRTVRPSELWNTLSYPGLWRLARRHWRSGITEVTRSLSRRRFTASVRNLVPDIDPADLRRNGAGVRAQAVTRQGALHDDFLLASGPRSVHVLNAPSPAATSALAIGEHLAAEIGATLGLD